ncbi:MAG: flagellar hook-associated protein FlgL [Syntrophomonadaceae bacterium]|jgi:flagellar hook-associated protein 3 FlgL|nr:flagellar hook-associated protein FlgL [Syntrophomonadaceae bacterium]
MTVRITNNMMINKTNRHINENYRRVNTLYEQLATTKKLNRPSDNPAGVVKSLRLRSNITESEQYVENIKEGSNYIDTIDKALGEIGEVIHRIRELTVEASNGPNNTISLDAIAKEIAELRDQISLAANTAYGTKYVFGGTNVTQTPCGDDAWFGNNKDLIIEIGPLVTVSINIDMTGFFGSPAPNAGDGGIFSVIDNVLNDIGNEDFEAITGNIDVIEEKIDEMLMKRSTLGGRYNRLEMQMNRLESTIVDYESLKAAVEDADMSEVITKISMQESVLKASLETGARIIQPTLFDFLS